MLQAGIKLTKSFLNLPGGYNYTPVLPQWLRQYMQSVLGACHMQIKLGNRPPIPATESLTLEIADKRFPAQGDRDTQSRMLRCPWGSSIPSSILQTETQRQRKTSSVYHQAVASGS